MTIGEGPSALGADHWLGASCAEPASVPTQGPAGTAAGTLGPLWSPSGELWEVQAHGHDGKRKKIRGEVTACFKCQSASLISGLTRKVAQATAQFVTSPGEPRAGQ